jgi:hypothetical protein
VTMYSQLNGAKMKNVWKNAKFDETKFESK